MAQEVPEGLGGPLEGTQAISSHSTWRLSREARTQPQPTTHSSLQSPSFIQQSSTESLSECGWDQVPATAGDEGDGVKPATHWDTGLPHLPCPC